MNYLKRDARQLQLFLLPCVLLIGGLVVWPAIYSIYLSLTNASLVGLAATHPRFVGERNYMRLFADGGFWNSLVVTFWFVLGSAIIGQFVLGLASAILLRRPLRCKSLFNSIILLPNAVPEVVAGYLWISMLAGGQHSTLNRLLGFVGIPSVRGGRNCDHRCPGTLRPRWLRAIADKRVVETAVPLRDRFSPRGATAGSHCSAL
jgi:multiple sugar transport system permease protein